MTPGIETLFVFIACYTLAFLWVILPEPGWAFAELPVVPRNADRRSR